MKKTIQIRISEDSHSFLKQESLRGIPITALADKAISDFKKACEQYDADFKAKTAILYPNLKIKDEQKTPITPRPVKLSTKLKQLQKDLKSGEFFTSSKYSADNVRNLDL